MPWKDSSFDAVFSAFAVSAFPDAGAAHDEMARVIKPGGKILIVDARIPLDSNPVACSLA